jgi:hypothetical protein
MKEIDGAAHAVGLAGWRKLQSSPSRLGMLPRIGFRLRRRRMCGARADHADISAVRQPDIAAIGD